MDSNEMTKNYASWEKRAISFVIDILTAGLLGVVLMIFLSQVNFEITSRIIEKLDFNSKLGFLSIHIDFYQILIIFFYYFLFESATKTTLGKIITRTKIVKLNGQKVKIQDILIRSLARLIPLEQLSYLTSHPIGIHDSLSNTRVISIKPNR